MKPSHRKRIESRVGRGLGGKYSKLKYETRKRLQAMKPDERKRAKGHGQAQFDKRAKITTEHADQSVLKNTPERKR